MDTIARENMEQLFEAFESSASIDVFLHDPDIFLPLHATLIDNPTDHLDVNVDFDGVVVEINSLKGVKIPFSKLNLSLLNLNVLNNSWHIVKKHLDLKKVSRQGLEHLKKIRGATLASLDGGYRLDIVVFPRDLVATDRLFDLKEFFGIKSLQVVNAVLQKFVELLKELPPKELGCDTFRKTVFMNKGSMNVLPQDQELVLSVLDQAVDSFRDLPDTEIRLFIYKFGQKSKDGLMLTSITDLQNINRYSLHVGCTFAPRDENTTMFWSRAGLQDMVGNRSKLFTCMSMHECVNMQTALDNVGPDVLPLIRDITTMPEKLTFVQFYVDSPHTFHLLTFRHPVTGLIVSCGLTHPNYIGAMNRRATDYILQMEDMAHKSICKYNLRVEIVLSLEVSGRESARLRPERFFKVTGLVALFKAAPIVVPFTSDPGVPGINYILSRCLRHMVQELKALGIKNREKGGFKATWKAFQLEIALEEAFYGHPLSNVDVPYAAALGTNSLHEFSLTHNRGFMGLGPFNAAAVEDSPPPLQHWTRDPLQAERIERIFPLTCCLDAVPAILGPELFKVLLKDLFRRNDRLPLLELQGPKCPGILKGHVNLGTLVKNLATRKSFPKPFTFARARELVSGQGMDVVECLKTGFVELKIRFFPDIKYRDLSGTRKATWNFAHYLEVVDDNKAPSDEATAMALVGDVAMEIERRGLSYARNLERYKEHGMPWLSMVLKRIPPRLTKETKFRIVTFTSSVGMLMNQDFVCFEKLKQLISEMGVSQAELQGLKILSSSLLQKVFGFNLWKLHYDIPYRMVPVAGIKPKKDPPKEHEVKDEEDAPLLDEHEQPNILPTRSEFLPLGASRKWMHQEMAYINLNYAVKPSIAYKEYVNLCKQAGLPARSYKAFTQKRQLLIEQN